MGIFQRRKQKLKEPVAPITRQELLNLPYAFDFDLPSEESKLRAALDHERAGGAFDIRKVFGSKGARNPAEKPCCDGMAWRITSGL